MTKLVEHHIKYKEIHGYDETVWITQSEHQKLHKRLRKDKVCNIPVDELRRISNAANSRTDKTREYHKNYAQTIKFKKGTKNYTSSERGIKKRQQYKNEKLKRWYFYDSVAQNVQHIELIQYNISTGNIYINCKFRADHGKKLYIINEVLK